MTLTRAERDWIEALKRQTQRDVERGNLDYIEAYRLEAYKAAQDAQAKKPRQT